jgi:hypothetical protein
MAPVLCLMTMDDIDFNIASHFVLLEVISSWLAANLAQFSRLKLTPF